VYLLITKACPSRVVCQTAQLDRKEVVDVAKLLSCMKDIVDLMLEPRGIWPTNDVFNGFYYLSAKNLKISNSVT